MCGKSKIVLADADESVRRMVARVLESFGYEVLTATTAVEALNLCQQAGPDLLLADLELLAEQPKKTTEILRRQRPPIPLLVMDAWVNKAQSLRQQGFDALVEKPFDLPDLIRIVQQLLQSRSHATDGGAPEEAQSLRYSLKPA